MGIGDSITLVSCLAGLMFALPALMIFLNLTFRRTTSATALRLQRGAVVPFFVGLVPAAVLAIPATLLISLGSIFQLLGTLLYLTLFLWAFTGLASIARLLGMRMGELANRPENLFAEALVGAFVLTFAIAFPLLGWLLVLPFGLLIGLGASFLALFNRAAYRQPPTYREETAATQP